LRINNLKQNNDKYRTQLKTIIENNGFSPSSASSPRVSSPRAGDFADIPVSPYSADSTPLVDTGSDNEEGSDKTSEQISSPQPAHPRRYSIFIPTPKQQIQKKTRVEEEEVEESTILELVVNDPESIATTPPSHFNPGGGGGNNTIHHQRGGGGYKIYRIMKLTPEVQQFMLTFDKPAKDIMTEDFLSKLIKDGQLLGQADADTEYDKIKNKLTYLY
jgi:hypothetical protein